MSKRNNEEVANDADAGTSNVETAARILKGAETDVTAARSDVDTARTDVAAARNARTEWEMNHPDLIGIYEQKPEWQFLNQRLNEANQRLNEADQRLNNATQRLKDITSIYQRGTGTK